MLAEHVAAPDHPCRCVSFMRVGGPDKHEEVPDLYGRSGISVVSTELPFLRGTWHLRTCP
jgi:hypothetical protein